MKEVLISMEFTFILLSKGSLKIKTDKLIVPEKTEKYRCVLLTIKTSTAKPKEK